MTPKERAAMQLALEALEMYNEHGAILRPLVTTQALRKALEQPVSQEPVTYVGQLDDEVIQHMQDKGYTYSSPLYAAPVRTKDLTDDELWALYKNTEHPIDIMRAVIAADREKNK